jgi:alkylation response protein AidB-like acyl-CoA dehydrogenase
MWVLNGMKRFIVFGRQAKLYMVTAKTDPSLPDVLASDGFLVPAGTPGLSFGHVEDKMGLRLCENAEVIFEDVRIPEKWRCNWMASVMMRGMTLNTFTAAVAVGIARRAFEEAIAYAQTRYKGGCLIIHHQAIQLMLADMATSIKAARLLTWQSAWHNEKGNEFTVLANMAKCLAAEMCVDVTTKAMEIFGGYGYMHDFPIEKLVRDAHVMPIYDATVEALKTGIITPGITVQGTA